VSYAADGGSVGPHVDAYDVFLLQAEGMRRWDISSAPQPELRRPGLELKQVKRFAPDASWLLMPGDMLYLPPGVAHHGVAFGECMTYSIGFRAPSQAEMLRDYAGLLTQDGGADLRYEDPGLSPTRHPGELTPGARARARQLLRPRLEPSDESLDIWFGCYMTEPKPWLKPVPRRRRSDKTALKAGLAKGRGLAWHAAVRVAWFAGRRGCHLFVDGEHHPLPTRLAGFARMVGDERELDPVKLRRMLNDVTASTLLLAWLDSGQLEWVA
jgi:50S ribosomal protein L16 3-hydroxylase